MNSMQKRHRQVPSDSHFAKHYSVEEAGFCCNNLLSVQGPAWLIQNFEEHWNQPSRRERFLDAIRWLEAESSLLGMGAHIMAIAKKLEN